MNSGYENLPGRCRWIFSMPCGYLQRETAFFLRCVVVMFSQLCVELRYFLHAGCLMRCRWVVSDGLNGVLRHLQWREIVTLYFKVLEK